MPGNAGVCLSLAAALLRVPGSGAIAGRPMLTAALAGAGTGTLAPYVRHHARSLLDSRTVEPGQKLPERRLQQAVAVAAQMVAVKVQRTVAVKRAAACSRAQ